MDSTLKHYVRLPFFAKFILLTIYTGILNSFALFIVYPALKSDEVTGMLASLIVYTVLALPLLIYIKMHFQPRPKRMIFIVGLLVMLGATMFQYFSLHIAMPILFLHLIFYLYAGMVEETLWRGKLWRLISRKTSSQLATFALVTIHFTILHIPFAIYEKPAPLLFLGQVLGLGILLGLLRIISKKVTVPAFAHAAVNMIVYT